MVRERQAVLLCVLKVCVALLCLSAAARGAPHDAALFPVAEMGLKLTFALAAPDLHKEHCFAFFSNTPFQGYL